ncbi:MAG: type IV pilus secretin family protein [Deltaproteobacteria bacterium]|nr:MAG: type IV pilus secretin family protein [Deltaproteobacteria bacterium]
MMRNRLRPKGRYSWRYQAWLAAAALVSAMVVVPTLVQADAEAPPAASGVKVEEVVVSKTPYYTNIEATVSGKIENYNSFKLNDPFRIVVDIWGVAQGAVASELPVGTPQVKSVKLSQQGDKLRMLVETPDDAPFPFLVTTEGNRLVLSVGGGQEGKVTSLDRPAAGMEPSKGNTVVGIDLEDLPDMSNVIITTSGAVPHEVVEGKDSVTLVFPGASTDKGLLREMDARKFDIPIRRVVPAAGKKGIEVAVAFAPGSLYSVKENDNAVVVSFPKAAGAEKGAVVAELRGRKASSMPAYAEKEMEPAGSAPMWGFVTHEVESHKKYVGQRISLDFKDADLANVFRILAEVSNLNIITTDDVKGRVSVRLINVPWDQALDIVLKSKALGATHEGNILRIAPLSSLRAEDKARLDSKKEVEKLKASLEGVIETIPVNYSKASDLKGKITDLLSEGGKVQVDDRTNVIIIRDLRKNVEDVKALVAKLDSATPQVLIEARIVEVDTSFTRELGVQWGGSYKSEGSTQFGATGIQDTSGAYIPGQTLTNSKDFTASTVPPNYAVNLPAAVGLGSGGGIAFGILSDSVRLDLSLSALEASGKGKVVSSPRVVTIDNKEAMIEQGTQIPYSTVSASGTNVQFVDATLSLKVTPHITPEGSVIMKLEAKNDSPGETGASGQPAINKKKATTEVLVRDGETAVIGGILQVTRKEDQQAVPWLSKIPILGFFFKHDTTQSSNRELLIFVTPKILKTEPAQARIY